MSDLFDDSEDVAIVPAPAEEKPQKKKPGRPRKAKTEGDEKKKVTIRRRTRVLGRIRRCGSLERIDLVSSGRGRIRGRRIDIGSALQDAVLLVFHVINLGIEIVNHRSLPCRS